jgi:short-subunit dehydrogenase
MSFSLNPPIRDWHNKVVWIVGASSGIGEALAQELVRRQAIVIASARSLENLQELSPAPRRTLALDISVPEMVRDAVRTLEQESLTPDIVFWVAGVYHPMESDRLNLEQVRETFNINTIAAYSGLAEVINLWNKTPNQPRHWSWISSVAGYRGLPQAAAYGASKAALSYFAEVSYLELKRLQIAVSLVCPGFVATRLTRKNSFKMPAILTPHQAALETLSGLARGAFEIHYPKRFTLWLKFLGLLPDWLYFRIMRHALPSRDQH